MHLNLNKQLKHFLIVADIYCHYLSLEHLYQLYLQICISDLNTIHKFSYDFFLNFKLMQELPIVSFLLGTVFLLR